MFKHSILLIACLMASAISSANSFEKSQDDYFWAQSQIEVGGIYKYEKGQPSYYVQANAGFGDIATSFIAQGTDEDSRIILANLRYSTTVVDIDIGRIGTQFGLQPAAYSATEPMPSDPDIYSTTGRLLLSSFGLPDVGVGLTYHLGGLDLSYRYYQGQALDQQQKQFVQGLVVISANDIQDAGPLTPGTCTLCQFANNLLGTNIRFTDIDDSVPKMEPEQSKLKMNLNEKAYMHNASATYLTDAIDYSVTGHHLHIGDLAATIITPSIQYHNRHINLGAQATIVRGDLNLNYYGSNLVITTFDSVIPYLKVYGSQMPIKSLELGAGLVFNVSKRIYIKSGYESLYLERSKSDYVKLDTFTGGISIKLD